MATLMEPHSPLMIFAMDPFGRIRVFVPTYFGKELLERIANNLR
jgi:hypothetical protein